MDITLSIIKYLSFAIAAFIAIWGMLNETSIKDDSGRKKLTKAGYVTVSLVLISAFMGMYAYHLENENKKKDKKPDIEKILFSANPIKNLDFSIKFSNLNIATKSDIKNGVKNVEDFWESDDELKFLESAGRDDLNKALERVYILFPLLRNIASSDNSNIMLILDLDGNLSNLVPIGIVEGKYSRGYLDNSTALSLQTNIHDFGEDANKLFKETNPLDYNCGRLSLDLSQYTSGIVSINGKIKPDCLDKIMHSSQKPSNLNIKDLEKSRVFILSGGQYLAVDPKNISSIQIQTGLCSDEKTSPKLADSIVVDLVITPNNDKNYKVTKKLISHTITKLEHGGGAEMDAFDYGKCLLLD